MEAQKEKKALYAIATMIFLLVSAITVTIFVKDFNQSDKSFEQKEHILQEEFFKSQQTLDLSESEYRRKVSEIASMSDVISIGPNCEMKPLIIEMSEGATIRVKNEDTMDRVIVFEDKNFFSVSAGEVREIDITKTFGKGDGVYRYRCGEKSENIADGIMSIISKE